MRYLLLLAILLLTTSCAITYKEPGFDVCYAAGSTNLHCFPVNQAGREEYNRAFDPKRDFVMDFDSYAALSEHHKLLHKRLNTQ